MAKAPHRLALLALTLAPATAPAAEYPIGEPVLRNGLEIGAVYLQPIEMEPAAQTSAPDAPRRPAIEAVVDGRVGAIPLGQVPPWNAGPQHEENPIHDPAVIDPPRPSGRRHQRFQYRPLFIRQIESHDPPPPTVNHNNELNLIAVMGTDPYADKYRALMDVFFDLVREDAVKVRIMFTQNRIAARRLSERHIEEQYFILYYEFIKHAFGLRYTPVAAGGVDIRLLLDQMPDTAEQVARFKLFLLGPNSSASLRRAGIRFKAENIVEVASHDHDLLQCLVSDS